MSYPCASVVWGEQCHEQIKLVCCLATLITIDAAAAAPPKDLYGKSITVFWIESRAGSGPQEGSGLRNPKIVLYISTAGRIFSRLSVQTSQRGFVGNQLTRPTATAEQGPGTSEARVGNTEFSGHSLIVTSQFASGARRVSVEFDDRFSSCQAKVMYGKEAGHNTTRQTNMFGGQSEEVGAVQTSSVGCTVRQGNAFTES